MHFDTLWPIMNSYDLLNYKKLLLLWNIMNYFEQQQPAMIFTEL